MSQHEMAAGGQARANGAGAGRARRWRVARAVALGGCVLVVAGCATMPASGAIPTSAGEQTGNTQDSTVQLIAVPPKDNEKPEQLLQGFLDDLASDEADYTMARKYLAEGTSWDPGQQVTVLDSLREMVKSESADGKQMTVSVTGTEIATLDAHHSYTPGDQTITTQDFVFQKNARDQWRISSLPSGILLNQQDFPRIYQSVNLYYPADAGTNSNGVSPLVADPVYLRSRIDPLTAAAQQLLTGPSKWLAPVVSSAFPANSSLDLDTSGPMAKAYVTLGSGGKWPDMSCQTMAAQLLTTLSQVDTSGVGGTPGQVHAVAVYQGHSGPPLCTSDNTRTYDPMQPAEADTVYYLNAGRHLMQVSSSSSSGAALLGESVPGQLLPSAAAPGGIGSFAVAPMKDGAVAAVTRDGSALYLSSLQATTPPSKPVLRSPSNGLSSPSWDGTGTLWVVDSGARPQHGLRALVQGKEVQVAVPSLQGQISEVRVAADGARIALLVGTQANASVQISRVHRVGTGSAPQLVIEDLHTVAQAVRSVSSLTWADGDSLVVLGYPSATNTLTPTSVEIDGSASPTDGGGLPALNGVVDVTAYQGASSAPRLIAATSDSIFRLNSTTGWAPAAGQEASKGSLPRFPG
jgi:hypothetical protein